MKAIYLRTSTDRQDGAAQRLQLAQAAAGREWSSPTWLEDLGQSGKRATRPQLDELRKLARAGQLRELLVTALDRLGRSSVDVCLLVDELAGAGVVIHSLREGTIDPKTPVGRFAVQMFAALAEMEHALIRERVKAGQQRAKQQGTRSGRPIGRAKREVEPSVLLRAFQMKKAGKSWRAISVACHVPVRTLRDKMAQSMGVGKTPSILPRGKSSKTADLDGRT
jgi:DNA invertase Pin-like site-specific DNA recombinase